MTLVIATTVLYPSNTLPTWLRFHLRRCSMILLYLDDPEQRDAFQTLCEGLAVRIFNGAQDAPAMSRPNRLIVRQCSNLRHAINHLLEHLDLPEASWLLHIDQDELLYEGGETSWEGDPALGHVTFTNHEAVPLPNDTQDAFRDCNWFNVNGPHAEPFMAYGNGKSTVRLSRGVEPDGPHRFKHFRGNSVTLPRTSAGDGGRADEEEGGLAGEYPVVLHYPYPSFEAWLAKFSLYGGFSDYWLDDESYPNQLEFMLHSRDKVVAACASGRPGSEPDGDGPWREAREFFATRVYQGQELLSRVQDGRVRRYAPLETPSDNAAE